MRRSQDWSWEFAPWCQLAYTWFTHNNFQVIDALWQTTPNSSKNHNKTKLHFAHFIWSSSWKLWKKRQLRPEIPRSTCLHIYVCIHINTYMQIQHTYTYVYIHTYIHAYIHTYIHTCDYIYKYETYERPKIGIPGHVAMFSEDGHPPPAQHPFHLGQWRGSVEIRASIVHLTGAE